MPNIPLDKRLVFAPFFAMKLGYDSVTQMLSDNKILESRNDTAADMLMNIIDRTKRNSSTDMTEEMLWTMGSNIREDLARINSRRNTPILLKYFQYLAALSAEYMLTCLADSPQKLIQELNSFVISKRSQIMPSYEKDDPTHLSKMAFWMATGSGKTLLMHLNYLQFLRHKIFAPDNIILITPNEEMSEQHLNEMRLSNIPCRSFGDSGSIYDNHRQNTVLIMDIHKLTAKKKSKKGISIPPETFAGRNLIFVDEGHKGVGGNAYFDIRDRLTKNGFAFEYSATFGNAIAANGGPARAKEYARAIVFNYSYGYFHADGYGKDYFILNMDSDTEDKKDILMLGNLLAFFQQKLVFKIHNVELQEYQIAPPLLLLLGASVVGGKSKTEDITPQTDIMEILSFLRRVVSDKDARGRPWLCATVKKILIHNSGLTAEKDGILFTDKFDFISARYDNNIEQLCEEMWQSVFYTSSPAALKFCPLKKTTHQKSGEIALRVEGKKPFALIYVGDTAKLRALAEDETQFGMSNVLEDYMQSPLFPNINRADSPINLLIGAKKFMEGWSSWRVCGIGLINVGRSEGPLIIQLFGRGVRLRGHNWSLKRSGQNIVSPSKKHLKDVLTILETLNIFGIRANFMSKFRDYLNQEGQTQESITIPVRVLPRKIDNKLISDDESAAELNSKKLFIPEMPSDDSFDKTVMLEKDDTLGEIQIDLSSSVLLMRPGSADVTTRLSNDIKFNNKTQKLIDFDDLYLRMLREYKNNRDGVIIRRDALPRVLGKCLYQYDNANGLPRGARLQMVAFAALCQYAEKQHGKTRRQWQKENMKFSRLQNSGKKQHANFINNYVVSIYVDNAEDNKKFKKAIKEMVEGASLYFLNSGKLPRIHFNKHLYQPLLTETAETTTLFNDIAGKIKHISPPPLNKGEEKFIAELKNYAERKNFPADVQEIYALRNQAKRGVGFYLEDGKMYYPDFILWVVGANRQRLVFVDPHGMRMANHYTHEYKAQLWKYLKNISQDKFPKNLPMEMDSYIVSVTSYEDMRKKWGWDKEEFQQNHIFFIEDLADDENRDALFTEMLRFKDEV